MMTLRHLEPTYTAQIPAAQMVDQRRTERRFCPSMFCFTDEIVVRRVSPKAQVWLLTDEQDDHTWLMMGQEPVCPHCGTMLL
jgi:hypothetical protein